MTGQPAAVPERELRREQVNRLYAVLNQEVSRNAPPDLGHWDPAWGIVAEPTNRLLDVARGYEDGTVGKEDLLRIAREVRHAWWEAAALYRRAQKQGTAMEQPA